MSFLTKAKTTLSAFALIALTLTSSANANSSSQKVIEQDSAIALFVLINQRLQYMPDVALYKAQNRLAIENLDREKDVLASAIKSSKTQGLEGNSVSHFFQSQMDVAKAIQYRYRADLLSDPIEKLAPDLNKTIRPTLIKLGDEIVIKLGQHIKTYGKVNPSLREFFYQLIDHPYITKKDEQMLFDGLMKIR